MRLAKRTDRTGHKAHVRRPLGTCRALVEMRNTKAQWRRCRGNARAGSTVCYAHRNRNLRGRGHMDGWTNDGWMTEHRPRVRR